MEGKILASGDLVQVVRGNRVTSRLSYRFKDGSVDDETTVFSQRGCFRLVTNHHIQRGPAFPHPTDVLINVATGQVTVRYTDDDGQSKVLTEHLELPSDLANGIILNILKNIRRDTQETTVSYLATTPKPRLLKLAISPQGDDTFLVAGTRRKAMRFTIKAELGGLTGLIAPIFGKQPENNNVWIAGGEAPAFVKLEGPLYLGGPVLNVEMTSPVWPHARPKKAPESSKK